MKNFCLYSTGIKKRVELGDILIGSGYSQSLPRTLVGETWTIKSFNGRTLVIEYKSGSGNASYWQTHTLIKQ